MCWKYDIALFSTELVHEKVLGLGKLGYFFWNDFSFMAKLPTEHKNDKKVWLRHYIW